MKKTLISTLLILTGLSAFCFDWPQAEVTKDSFNSYFGQNRGGTLSTSVIFSEPEEVKAAENGYITVILTENSDDSEFFPSTLGTAVILAHNDELISVYGNLDAETLTIKNEKEHTLDGGAIIASSGNSGYQENNSNLEFKIIDDGHEGSFAYPIAHLFPKSRFHCINKSLLLSFFGLLGLNGKEGLADSAVIKTVNLLADPCIRQGLLNRGSRHGKEDIIKHLHGHAGPGIPAVTGHHIVA